MWARVAEIEEQQLREQVQAAVPRLIRRCRMIHRNHAEAHDRLFADYFAEQPSYPATVFRRHFRMQKELFLRIVNALSARYEYFQLCTNAAGKIGLLPLQKCTVAIRQLAYGGTVDMFDEYLHAGDTTGRECLKNFCLEVRETFRDLYVEANLEELPNGVERLVYNRVQRHAPHHHTRSYCRSMTLDLAYAYFGVAGSNNDLNVLQSSPLFNQQCRGLGPAIDFTVNDNPYKMGYYLADDIYPSWPIFFKTIRCSTEPKRAYFAQKQEAARKDVERAFGVLQAR
ncbi:uncharacterized protein LOC121760459 [Salvia splendens]|uniref:uncharacterized protein LOC121760459 n=1 Tax=Salvia splendens TaxID=180675 RepID=UPI001C25B9E6|nr:uncharacterized protein LOC121760459 [Salvia splendens]